MQTWKDGRYKRERESCERQVCYRVTCKDNESKNCIHGDKERVKEQYSPSNTDIPITELSIKKKKKASHIMYFNEGIYTR